MKIFFKCKKGVSLIEVVISVAILQIILLPILSMVLTSVKINRVSEDKLKANAVAEKYMEQIQASDSCTHLSTAIDPETKFKIEITMTENNKYMFSSQKGDGASTAPTESLYDMNIYIDGNNITGPNIISTTSDYLNGKSIQIENQKGKLQYAFGGEAFREVTKLREVAEGLVQIVIKSDPVDLSGKKSSTDIRFEVRNSCGEGELKIYVVKYPAVISTCSISNKEGSIKQYLNVEKNSTTYSNTSRVYDVEIKVSKDGAILQQISGTKTALE